MRTVLSLRFPAGRCHATPWGSHANEAEVEWPPSPWRILRALVATWHRKVSPAEFPETVLESLIDTLATVEPVYSLPPISRAHSRHYMPVRSGVADRPVLIFDGFARIDADAEVVVAWPDIELDGPARELLGVLANGIGYLGRAESWVEARLLDGYDGGFNSAPVGSSAVVDRSDLVPVKLLAPTSAATYAELRERSVHEWGLDAKRLTKSQRLMLATLPARLLDALRAETGDLRNAGWNLPPGARTVTYERPRLDTTRATGSTTRAVPDRRITTARLALAGRPLPRFEDAVRIGELVRIAAISAADRIGKGNGVPPEISGHKGAGELNHRHAFYLPEDADGDGFIDHVLVHAPGGLSRHAVAALDAIHRRGLWARDGEEWDVVFEGAWETAGASRSTYGDAARTWISATPYLHPWYRKPGFGVPEQIRRECAEREIGVPAEIRFIEAIRVASRERRPVHFHRFRSKRGLRQPDSRGSMAMITFTEPMAGPLALGFGCHYGLGVFRPVRDA